MQSTATFFIEWERKRKYRTRKICNSSLDSTKKSKYLYNGKRDFVVNLNLKIFP